VNVVEAAQKVIWIPGESSYSAEVLTCYHQL
jgi:hypothetical protein